MATFTVHTIETAPTPSKALLEKSEKEWGFIPTLHGILAESAPTCVFRTILTADSV